MAESPFRQTCSAEFDVISFACSCGKRLKVGDASAGKKVKCPGCRQVAVVPGRVAANGIGGTQEIGAVSVPEMSPSTDDPATLPPSSESDATIAPGDAGHEESAVDWFGTGQSKVAGEMGRLGVYRILRQLGMGGMGAVFEAEDSKLDRCVALKVMKPEIARNPLHRERFLREARVAAMVESDFICPIYQVGEENGVPYIAMPFLKGEPLNLHLKRVKRLPVEDVVRIGREVAEGLSAAHDAGLFHRDIKPANIWLETQRSGPPRARILDFGLARQQDEVQITQSGAILGTPAFMSPEQARGNKKVDARTDLFSLGCVLYVMCTGEQPFKADTTMGILMALATENPVPPREVSPTPQPLSDLILRLLAKKADDRPPTARDVIETLIEIEGASAKPAKDQRIQPAPARPTTPTPKFLKATQTTDTPPRATSASPRRTFNTRVATIAGGLGSVLVLLAAGLYFMVADRDAIKIKTPDDQVVPVVKGKEPPPKGRAETVYLDDLQELEWKNGHLRLGKHGLEYNGWKFTWRDKEPTHALSTHPLPNKTASVRYRLDGHYETFSAVVGIADVAKPGSTNPVVFRVVGDGRELWKSPPLQKTSEEATVSVSVRDIKELTLEVSCGNDNYAAHAIWFEPRLTRAPRDAPPLAKAPFDAKEARSHQVAWAEYLGVPVEFTNTFGMKFILIPPGEFVMGCDAKDIERHKPKILERDRRFFENYMPAATPHHSVRITRPIYMQTHEVSNGQYQKALGQLPHGDNAANPDGAVMQNVTLADAVVFCDALSRKEGRVPAYQIEGGKTTRIIDAGGYRLPTEAEWEYACRAGTTTWWFFGDDVSDELLRDYQTDQRGASAKPNPFGLFDMYAGSLEWCFDRMTPYAAGEVVDPFNEPGDTDGVARGGSMFAGGGCDVGSINSVVRHPIRGFGFDKRWYGVGRVVLPIEMKTANVAPGGPPIDLLAKVNLATDTEKHVLYGEWKWEGKTLVSPGGLKAGRLNLKYRPPPEYELTAVVERVHGTDGVLFYLNVDGHPCALGIDVFPPTLTGLGHIDGKELNENESTVHGAHLKGNKQFTIRIVVGKRSVRASVDGQQILHWEGDPARLSYAGSDHTFSFKAAYHQFKFHRMEIRPLDSTTATKSGTQK